MFYLEEDLEAIEFLKEKGVFFNLIDLSRCPVSIKIKAMLKGANRTSTLVLDNGVKKIKEYFEGSH